ncbi:MAG: hypothetical protein DME24_21600 [Verrucomicrobia bacterium]|nr:MAG: hypothetical protein DME24_21600 [Verrucomicrobiota bacterium]
MINYTSNGVAPNGSFTPIGFCVWSFSFEIDESDFSAVLRSVVVINPPLLSGFFHTIFRRMLRLTKQEQLALCVVLSLLLVGWTVRAWRTAHPPAASNKQTK